MSVRKSSITLITGMNFPPTTGGISQYLYGIVAGLLVDEVCVIALPAPDCQDFDRMQHFFVERLPLSEDPHTNSRLFKFLFPLYFWRLLHKGRLDIVLCGQAHHTLMLPAWLISKLKRMPYGVFTYGLDILRPQQKWHRYLFNYLLKSASIVYADSRAAQEILFQLGLDPEKTCVIHPSVDINRLQSQLSVDEVRKRHALNGKKLIFSVARLVERKGFDTMLRALPIVLNSVPSAHYVIGGKGPYETSLKSLVSELNLEDHVTFIGYVADDELAAYYAACDVFVMISREIAEEGDVEGFGIVYLEANILGKPVVAGHSGGVPDAVVDGKSGLLVDPGDEKEVATAVISILQDQEYAKQLGEFGRQRAINEFSSQIAARKVLAALSQITD